MTGRCCTGGAILAANEALDIINRPEGVSCSLVLSSISDETLAVREGHVRWCDAVTLVVGNDLHTAALVYTHA